MVSKVVEDKLTETKDEKVLEFPERNVEKAIIEVNQFFSI